MKSTKTVMQILAFSILITLIVALPEEPQFGCARVVLQIDKGFVAQVAFVVGGKTAPINDEQREEAEKTVIDDFSEVKHVRRVLSMVRNGSSYEMLGIRLRVSFKGNCPSSGLGD